MPFAGRSISDALQQKLEQATKQRLSGIKQQKRQQRKASCSTSKRESQRPLLRGERHCCSDCAPSARDVVLCDENFARRSELAKHSIPARAGKLGTRPPIETPAGVHPRARRNRQNELRQLGGPGCIPARAGKSCRRYAARHCLPVHPRARRETTASKPPSNFIVGASPRVRGNRVTPTLQIHAVGCIPARGNHDLPQEILC